MKDDIIKRPATSHYTKAVPPRTNGATARPTATARSLVKRTSSVSHPSMDANFKRRIINANPSGITISSNTRYANVAHVQSLNMNPSAISRIKNNGPLNIVPSALTAVTVQSSIPSVVLPPEPKMHNSGLKNFDGGVFNV
ncbi:unnamed protein product [Cercopithifilaria johnstoni]|nr:unnamed protein product [Cercopithifilaria johnstoni]